MTTRDPITRLNAALEGRYRIESELGKGGMATVYLAEDLKHKRKVAVKVLLPELAAVLGAERFVQEITTTANLQHPHILPLFDSGEADGFLYYVMPFIEGETLREKLDRETQLGIEEAVGIASNIADALDSAHKQGVIHRDIKPANILLHNGRPMVADFGIALAVSAAGGGRMTETGLSLGTPHYMSPEQATAEKDLTPRSDIYSLGSVLYEMLTGQPPHAGGSAQQIIMKIVTDEARPVTELRKSVPPHVAAATATALEKLAADRFETAAKFAEALANPTFMGQTMHVGVAGASSGIPPSRVTAGVGALAAVAIAAALWGWLRPLPEGPRPVSRYSIDLPEGEELGRALMGSRIAVSPDGSRLVYRGSAAGGASDREGQGSRLLLRDRDRLHATPIPGTEGGALPFFSPDGTKIGFLNESSWRAVSLAGGSATTIGEVGSSGTGASWGYDGHIYFGGNLPGLVGLVRVLEGGGPHEPVTQIDTTRGEDSHHWPEPLPGGRGVLFTAARAGIMSFHQWDIAVVDFETGRHTVLVQGARARYAAGHLVYVTGDGTLMAVPFDETTLELTGDAMLLGEGLELGFMGSADLAISETGTLLYTTGDLYRGNASEVVWVTRDGTVEAVDPTWTGDFRQPVLSPDGTQLAVSRRTNEVTEIWIKELDRGLDRRLTFAGTAFYPSWTHDGQSLAYVVCCGKGLDFYRRRADGSGQAELLMPDEGDQWEITHSPGGEWLVYGVYGAGNPSTDLYGLRVGDSVPVPLVVTDFDEEAPAVSPDGRWLAYVSGLSGTDEVYVVPFPNTDGGRWMVSANGGQGPVWARSGRELFYVSGGGRDGCGAPTRGDVRDP